MAFVLLTAQSIVPSGLEAVYTAATLTDGNKYRNQGREIVHIKNASGVSVTVTFPTPAEVSGLTIEDIAIVIPAGEERFVGDLNPALFNEPVSSVDAGMTRITYSAVTSVTVAILLP